MRCNEEVTSVLLEVLRGRFGHATAKRLFSEAKGVVPRHRSFDLMGGPKHPKCAQLLRARMLDCLMTKTFTTID